MYHSDVVFIYKKISATMRVFTDDEIIYLGVFIVRANKFKCSIDQAKRAFFVQRIVFFAKVRRLASEEVIVQLLKQKWLPILLYGLDVCNLDKRSTHSLDFTVNSFFNDVVSDI